MAVIRSATVMLPGGKYRSNGAVATAVTPLSERARKRGLITLLADTFLVFGGFFMVVPLISVHYVNQLGWAAATVGLVLGIRQLVQQGLTPISGIFADRLGAKGLISAGLLLRAIGFLALIWANTFSLLLFAAVLAALGGSLFDSPRSAAIAALTEGPERNRYYSLVGTITGIGIALGTQVGALLINTNFALVALISAACFFVDFVVTLIFLPSVRVAAEGAGGTLFHGVGMVLRDRPFVIFTVLLMGYWFMWVQFTISLPLVAEAISGTSSSVSWIYGINSVMLVLLSYPLLRLAGRWLRPLPLLIVGMLLMALGFGAVGLISNVPGLLLCAVCISLGTLLAAPSQQTVAASLANPDALGSYFGINALALAIGGGFGNVSGGVLYDLGHRLSLPALPWTIFFLVGVAAAGGLWLMGRRQRRHHVAAPDLVPSAVPAASVS